MQRAKRGAGGADIQSDGGKGWELPPVEIIA
jgi:hypothetical protein